MPTGTSSTIGRPVGAVLARAASGLAAAGLEPRLLAERGKIPEILVRDEDHVAPTTAVTPVRAAPRHVLLAPEAEPTVAAATRQHLDAGAIVEHG